MRRLALIGAYVAFLVGAVFAYAAVTNRGRDYYVHQSKSVGLSGHVTGLYPGVKKNLNLKIVNGAKARVIVRQVRIEVRSSSSDCESSNLEVAQPKGKANLKRGQTATMKVPVQMNLEAPEACQGTKFKLQFHAKYRWPT